MRVGDRKIRPGIEVDAELCLQICHESIDVGIQIEDFGRSWVGIGEHFGCHDAIDVDREQFLRLTSAPSTSGRRQSGTA